MKKNTYKTALGIFFFASLAYVFYSGSFDLVAWFHNSHKIHGDLYVEVSTTSSSLRETTKSHGGKLHYSGYKGQTTLQQKYNVRNTSGAILRTVRKDAALLLAEILRDLRNSSENEHDDIKARLKSVAKMLDHRVEMSDMHFPEDTTLRFPKNAADGSQREAKTLSTASCDVTVLINMAEMAEDNITLEVARSVLRYDRTMPIIVAIRRSQWLDEKPDNFSGIVVKSYVIDDWTPGGLLNNLVSFVRTKYVLITRDMTSCSSHVNIERQIRVLSLVDSIGVVSGASRNSSGHWGVGCYQTDIRNYVLRFIKGYQYTISDCMFCDYISGPFLVKISTFRVPFSEDLPEGVLFEDWFLRLKQNGVYVASCPDVLYDTRGERINTRILWMSLALQWNVVAVERSPKVKHKFSCKELDVNCNPDTKYHLLPPCCLLQIKKAMRALEDFAVAHNTTYEMESGSVMGAVKFQGFVPWDIDGDISFLDKDYDSFESESKSMFTSKGLKLKFKWRAGGSHRYSYIILYSPDISIEMFGEQELGERFLPKNIQHIPSKTEVVGEWIRGPGNPGLYCRNRYGYGYLKHAQSWRHTNIKSAWDVYIPGMFLSCPERHKHSCLEHYPTDGNLDFDAYLIH